MYSAKAPEISQIHFSVLKIKYRKSFIKTYTQRDVFKYVTYKSKCMQGSC